MNYPGFIGPANKSQSVLADCSRLVNLYLEQRTQTGRPGLIAWPGQSRFVDAPTAGRALFSMNNRTLAVNGAKLYRVNGDQTLTDLGNVGLDEFRAYITMNGRGGGQALIASVGDAYVLDLDTMAPVTSPVLVDAAHQVGMLDGYGIAFDRTLARFRISALNDFGSWDPTDFQGRNDAPDDWQAMLVNAPDIWLVGSQTGCVWYDAGDFPIPFAPRPGVNFNFGIVAPDSIAAAGDSVFWLSANREGAGIVVRARGYVPQRFSGFAVETAIAGYLKNSRIDDAEGLGLQWQGHTFYIINFRTAGHTWAVDVDTGDWFELSTRVAGQDAAWSGRVHCLAFGKHLVAGPLSGTIAFLDETSATEVDGTLMRLVRVPPSLVSRDGRRMTVSRLQLLAQGGIGTQTGQGQDPQIMLRVSQDYAQTWGNERRASLGRVGKTQAKMFWTRLISSETGWVPEIVITDPVRPIAIIGADITGQNLGIGGDAAA